MLRKGARSMFWRILKKDLKRKKTMNVIILLFVIICSTFASASINNIVAVTNGVDHFYEISNVPDLEVNMKEDSEAYNRVAAEPSVTEIKKLDLLMIMSSKSFSLHGEKLDTFINPAYLMSDEDMIMNFFDEDNKKITEVEKGKFYSTTVFLDGLDIKKGDEVTIKVENTEITLEYAGYFKGAMLPTSMGSSPYLLINREDYRYLDASPDMHIYDDVVSTDIFFIKTDDLPAVMDILDDYSDVSTYTPEEAKAMYLLDMVTAYILMIVSILLMITAFVVLRFTTGFTISEEFREIGVMKAVGITNPSIRRLYIVKYFAIAIVGAIIGFLISIPLANYMLKTISMNLVLEGGDTTYIGFISTVFVVAIIMLFCYNSTSKIKKLSPIDAVRNGQTGERFKKKSVMHLSRSRGSSTGFLAMNDVASAPKRYIMITVIIALGMLMTSIMASWSRTLRDDKLHPLFSIVESDATIMDTETMGDVIIEDDGYITVLDDIEQRLEDNGMPARVAVTMINSTDATYEGEHLNVLAEFQEGHFDNTFSYDEGTAPSKPDEIAVTSSVMKMLDVDIGDTLSIKLGDEYRSFIITGKYSSFASPGVRFCDHFDLTDVPKNGCMGIQVKFTDDLTQKQLSDNIEKLKDLFDTNKIYSTSEFISLNTGIGDTLESLRVLTLILTVMVTAMVVVLMERSFISREKSEIALMKAVGISNFSIIAQHTIRFVITAVAASFLSFLAVKPLSEFGMNLVCSMIGDVSSVECTYNPFEIYLLQPAILIAATIISAFLTATYTRTIKASDTASIE